MKSALPIEKTARLVSRALGVTPEALDAGLRQATPADLPSVAALRREVLTDQLTWDDAAYLHWRYGLGAPGAALATCWVCTRGDEVLGMIGTEALQVQAGGHERVVHVLMDLMVRPELDGTGLGVWINQAMTQRLGCVLAIGSNPNSKGVVARTFEVLPDRRSHTHPLHFNHFMAKRLGRAWLARLAAPVADVVFSGARMAVLWLPTWWVRVSRIQHGAALGPQVAALLQRSRRNDRVEVLRTVEKLTHRLLRNPRAPADIWLAWRGDQVIGLLAVRPTAIEAGRHALQLMDVVLAPGFEQRALRALMARVTAHGFLQGADYLTATLYDAPLEAALKRMFFRQQANAYETLAWHCPDATFKQAVVSALAWSLCDIHTDRDQS